MAEARIDGEPGGLPPEGRRMDLGRGPCPPVRPLRPRGRADQAQQHARHESGKNLILGYALHEAGCFRLHNAEGGKPATKDGAMGVEQ